MLTDTTSDTGEWRAYWVVQEAAMIREGRKEGTEDPNQGLKRFLALI